MSGPSLSETKPRGHGRATWLGDFDLDETLREWAKKLLDYEPPADATKDERTIRSVMKTQIPRFRALRLPDEITGGMEGYTISLRVPWSKLPGRKLILPYVYCKVLLGDDGDARPIDYPDARAEQ